MNIIKRAFSESGSQEFLRGYKDVSKMTLDDLYMEAKSIGEVEMGSSFYPYKTTIKLPSEVICGDYLHVQCKKHDNIKQNLADCIDRARKIISFYRSL
jgi:hypothetical protein